MTQIGFSCDCGTIRGTLAPEAVSKGTHITCHCPDCRAAPIALGRPDPGPDPVGLLHTLPSVIAFEAGQDQLRLLRLSPKGLMRWYAGCCNTPMFNTLLSPKLAFVGIVTDCLNDAEPLGKPVCQAFVPQPKGGRAHKGTLRLVLPLASRLLSARLSGTWRDTPFFDDNGKPVEKARVLTREERAAAARS